MKMGFLQSKVRPFFWGLFPKALSNNDIEFLQDNLNKQEQILFYRMQNLDQRHALQTAFKMKELLGRRMKINHEKMYIAALLHDVGKTEYQLKLRQRVIVNILSALIKPLVNWLADKSNKWAWCKPYYIHVYHPQRGAELARGIGVDENVAYLIEHHHDQLSATEPIELTLLREADKFS